ncbi:MAG: hypothetical protein WCO93_11700 [bacterium]
MKRIHILLSVAFLLSVSVSFAQSGRIIKTDGAEITFRHLVGVMIKDTVYSPSVDLQKYFRVVYNGKQYDVYFDKLKTITFFSADTTFMYKLETKSGLSADLPLNFVGLEYITDDPLSSDMMRACLPVVTNNSSRKSLNIKAIYFD